MDPYLVLNLPLAAGDAEVRAAYQELLRTYPPEQCPEEFQIIQEAYEKLRSSRDRWTWRLLDLGEPPVGPMKGLENFARLPGRMRPPGARAFRSLLSSCTTAAAAPAKKR